MIWSYEIDSKVLAAIFLESFSSSVYANRDIILASLLAQKALGNSKRKDLPLQLCRPLRYLTVLAMKGPPGLLLHRPSPHLLSLVSRQGHLRLHRWPHLQGNQFPAIRQIGGTYSCLKDSLHGYKLLS